MKIIKISYPNDYNSDEDFEQAMLECYGDNPEAAETDNLESILERLAGCANKAGLKFVEATSYGARWKGTEKQVKACTDSLPYWAYVDE